MSHTISLASQVSHKEMAGGRVGWQDFRNVLSV